ncbi:MAG TPA: response regulator [Blastocatellia bacterium]|nr:response regulator [Blastocatellia bacterium]
MTTTPIKVLVIEDDEYSRDALAHLLCAEGYDAESATDGESGYTRAREIKPDIIVLDLSLPGIDGKQVINMVRHDDILKSVPILVITGQDDSVAKATLNLGADAYLTKPIEFDDLTIAISNLNKQSSAAILR